MNSKAIGTLSLKMAKAMVSSIQEQIRLNQAKITLLKFIHMFLR